MSVAGAVQQIDASLQAISRLISLPPDLLAAVAQYILWHEWFALILAARGGHNGITEALRVLIAAGADVDSRHTGCRLDKIFQNEGDGDCTDHDDDGHQRRKCNRHLTCDQVRLSLTAEPTARATSQQEGCFFVHGCAV